MTSQAEPTTEAGRDMLANHGYRRPVDAEWIIRIEDAARLQREPEMQRLQRIEQAALDAFEVLNTMGNGEGWTLNEDVIFPLGEALGWPNSDMDAVAVERQRQARIRP